VVSRISDEELAEAMAANFDEYGNDIALARDVAAMTPEQRKRSQDNLRRWVERLAAEVVRSVVPSPRAV